MRIGIVTPAFNVAPTIGDTIRSVLEQTHRDWTMVVVDDGSGDDTVSVVKAFPDRRLRLISQQNAGVSAARNRGAALLDCDALLFLDGDDWLAPSALEVLAQALDAEPEAIAAVGPYARGGRVYPPPSGNVLEPLLVRNIFVNGGHVLIRRAAVQPFREDLRYGEDWECWVRLALSAVRAGAGWGSSTTGAVFAAPRGRRPLLFVRERPGSAYLSMATDPASFAPCLNAIHGNPALPGVFSTEKRAALRRKAEAEVLWTIGREMIRHRRRRDGLSWLGKSVAAAPTLRRLLVMAAVAALPPSWCGPLYPYDRIGR